VGDLSFQSQRRSWIQTASRAGVKTFGYLFTQPQPNSNPAIGGMTHLTFTAQHVDVVHFRLVSHGSEVTYVYGAPSDQSASSLHLSSIMIDYWVSFATSLDPNDGRGNPRKFNSSYNVFKFSHRNSSSNKYL